MNVNQRVDIIDATGSLARHSGQRNISQKGHTLHNMSLKRKAVDVAAEAAKKPKANGSITSFFGQPKSSPPTSSANPSQSTSSPTAPETIPVKFDKDAWMAKLTAEQKQLLKLEIETLHESWLAVLKDEVTSPQFLELKRFLKKEVEGGKKVFPPSEDVYSWYIPSSTVLKAPH